MFIMLLFIGINTIDLDVIQLNENIINLNYRTSSHHYCCSLHVVSFKGFFLTSLGSSFLHQLYHSFIDEGKGSCVLAVQADQTLEETNFLLQLADENNFIFFIIQIYEPGTSRKFFNTFHV